MKVFLLLLLAVGWSVATVDAGMLRRNIFFRFIKCMHNNRHPSVLYYCRL